MSTLKITSSSLRALPQLTTRRSFSASASNNSSILRKLSRKNASTDNAANPDTASSTGATTTASATTSTSNPATATTTAKSTTSNIGRISTGSIASRLSKIGSSRFGASATTSGSGNDTAADAMRLKFGGRKSDKPVENRKKNNNGNNNKSRSNQGGDKSNNSFQRGQPRNNNNKNSTNNNNKRETPASKNTEPKVVETVKEEPKTEAQIQQDEYKKKKQAEKEKYLRRELVKEQEKQEKKLASTNSGGTSSNGSKVKEIEAKKVEIAIPQFISIANLAKILAVRLETLTTTMKDLGFEQTAYDFILDSETANLIAEEFGFETVVSDTLGVDLFAAPIPADVSHWPARPPIVTIMGHVDHGKTTVLDYLRKSSVVSQEHGGITQHIGAFSVKTPTSGKVITFLDTPGHSAFLKMRERGATVTDIVILVVAGDDSVMPQTKEAIKHAHAAGVPMIVAMNKMDKPGINPEKVLADLAANEVDIEDYGGDTQVVKVSGLTGMGIDKLEEAIITLSEIQDLRGDPKGNVEGWVIESQIKKGLGNVATVLVRRGTIKPGVTIVAGNVWCKVRTIKDDKGKILKEAGPGAPVEIIGWKDLPEAGDEVLQSKTENEAKQAISNRLERAKRVREAKDIEIINQKRHLMKLEQEMEQAKLERIRLGLPEEDPNAEATATKPDIQEVNFIVRADVSGSVEAIIESIEGLGNKEIKVRVLSSGVGSPSLSDLERAEISKATVLAFNVKVEKEVMNKSLRSNTPIRQHNIIYKLLEDVTEILTNNLPTETKIKVLGEAMIKDVFEITGKRNTKVRVAGCKVNNGLIKRGALVRVFRGKEGSSLSEKKEVYKGKVDSLKHHKDDINEIKKDKECGIGFDGWKGFEQGDIIQTYEEFEIKRHL